MAIHDTDAGLLRDAVGGLGGTGAAMFAPPLVIDVRQWHKKGLLRDAGATFPVWWQSGDRMMVTAEREAVKLGYVVGGKEVALDVRLAWSAGRPLFVCQCERRTTKLLLERHTFVCRRCYERTFFPPRPKRRPKRIPAKQRLRVLARDRFRCVGCHTTEGGLIVRRACGGCESYMGYEFDQHLAIECRVCYELSRGGFRGLRATAHRLRSLGLWDIDVRKSLAKADATSATRPLDQDNVMRSQNLDELQREAATKEQIRIYKKVILRSLNGQKSAHRVIVKLVCGLPTCKIAAQEGVNRSTVWRHRQRLKDAEATLFPLARQMMERAARREDWDEARFWRQALLRAWLGRFTKEYCIQREWMKAEQNITVPKSVMREWRPHFETIRDEVLGRSKTQRAAA